MMLVLVLGHLAVAQPAGADVGLTIGVAASSSVAPATVVVTASVTSSDPVVTYDWNAPSKSRCRAEDCSLSFNISSCRRISVEVTTLFGDTAAAERVICVADDDGKPPEAQLAIDDWDPDVVRVSPGSVSGSSVVVRRMLWVDDVGPKDETIEIERDGGCHAVDLVVIDAEGRAGFDQRSICFSEDAPRLWLGGDPCPLIGQQTEVCAEAEHPLGLTITQTSGQPAFGNCGPRSPRALERTLVRAEDGRGVASAASLLLCGAPAVGAPTLMFLDLPDIKGSTGDKAPVRLLLYGGEPPFDIDARADVPTTIIDQDTKDPIVLLELPEKPGALALEVSLVDARGLSASAATTVTVEIGSSSPAGTMSAEGSGCSAVRDLNGSTSTLLLLFYALWRRR